MLDSVKVARSKTDALAGNAGFAETLKSRERFYSHVGKSRRDCIERDPAAAATT